MALAAPGVLHPEDWRVHPEPPAQLLGHSCRSRAEEQSHILCCFPKGLWPLCGVVDPELSCWAAPKLSLQLPKAVSERGMPGMACATGCHSNGTGDKGVILFSCYVVMVILLCTPTSAS